MPIFTAKKSVYYAMISVFLIAVFYGNIHSFKRAPEKTLRPEKIARRKVCDKTQSQIPIIVFTCNRATAAMEHIQKLIRLRPDAHNFPIFVSQQCDNSKVTEAMKTFAGAISFRKFPGRRRQNSGRYRQYYAIAHHYKLGLDWVFEDPCFDAVIVTEDDLDVSDDFFAYFTAMLPILRNDSSLLCVSAWNDNGREQNIDVSARTLFYRTDFFSGLGWMTTRKIWEELSPMWPDGFWDDWLRQDRNRKGRQCIRPEIGRTAMTRHGAKGASNGQFFKQYIEPVVQIKGKVNYSEVDLEILKADRYKKAFDAEIRRAKTIKLEELASLRNYAVRPVKIFYNSNNFSSFENIAGSLGLMTDSPGGGVARLSYENVVTAFRKGVRIYLVPENYAYR